MNIRPVATPSGDAVFFDDIRQEASGKAIYIGVYGEDMRLLRPPPLVLQKLCVMIRYKELRGACTSDIRLCVYLPGIKEPTFDVTIARAQIDIVPSEDGGVDPDLDGQSDHLIFINITAILENVPIKEQGRIRVRAFVDNEMIKLAALRVHVDPAIDTKPPSI